MNSSEPLVVLVDGNAAERSRTDAVLRRHGYRTLGLAPDAFSVERIREAPPAAVLLAVRDEPAATLDLLALLKRDEASPPVILVSGDAQTSTVVQAMRLGDTDFLCQPLVERVLIDTLTQALHEQRLTAELVPLKRLVEAEPKYRMLTGRSPLMQEVRQRVAGRVPLFTRSRV